jgi:hypothetical protein
MTRKCEVEIFGFHLVFDLQAQFSTTAENKKTKKKHKTTHFHHN